MLLSEGLAFWWDLPFMHTLFASAAHHLTAATNPHPLWKVLPEISLVPYICSELFFNHTIDDTFPKETMLVLCNDTWSAAGYIRRLRCTYQLALKLCTAERYPLCRL